jgi:integrase
MASLRKLPGSKNHIACYTDAEGKQRQRSTGTADAREAQGIADAYEAAWRNQRTEAQIRRTLSDISERLNGAGISRLTLGEWFASWLERVQPEVSANTHARYQETTVLVRELAPAMVEKPLDRVTQDDVYRLRAALVAARSTGTTNQTLKILRMCFKRARGAGLIVDNPALDVPRVKPTGTVEAVSKRPFSIAELKKLMAAADDEWRGIIFAGLYTAGQRLSDVATMTAGQVDLRAGAVRFKTDKTGRDVLLPIAAPWLRDLRKRVKGKAAGEPLFPRAHKRFTDAGGRVGRVSNSFRALMAKAGLAPKPNITLDGAVVGRRRTQPLSFHSFRHTATSMLKNAGVSDSVARDIVGHESAAVSANYTHIDEATKRMALGKLADISRR